LCSSVDVLLWWCERPCAILAVCAGLSCVLCLVVAPTGTICSVCWLVVCALSCCCTHRHNLHLYRKSPRFQRMFDCCQMLSLSYASAFSLNCSHMMLSYDFLLIALNCFHSHVQVHPQKGQGAHACASQQMRFAQSSTDVLSHVLILMSTRVCVRAERGTAHVHMRHSCLSAKCVHAHTSFKRAHSLTHTHSQTHIHTHTHAKEHTCMSCFPSQPPAASACTHI
jgi:hypothetical protein